MNTRTSILVEAETLINKDRAEQYGPAQESFGCIATMWGAYLGYPVTTADVCHLIALLKIARLRNGPHRDSKVDGAGYMALVPEMREGEWTQ